MSIFNGLVKKIDIVSRFANQFNTFLDSADKREKVSSAYKAGNHFYSYGTPRQTIAKYPMDNELQNLSIRPSYTYTIVCIDYNTGVVLDHNTLNFEILSINGDFNYTTTKNSSSFNVVINNLPKNKIIKASVKISGSPDYLNAYAQIKSDGVYNNHTQEVSLVNINNLPDGVGVSSLTVSQNENGTTSVNTVSIPASSSKYESSSFEIPAGTKFYDKDGNRLNGDITVRIGHFSPTNPDALSLFTPGWTVSNLTENGIPFQDDHTTQFITGGFFSVEVYDNSGSVAVDIGDGEPIKGRSSINPDLMNSDTDSPFVVGDTMPYWRLNPDGSWEQIDTAVVVNDNGTLVFDFEMSAFSLSNLDNRPMCNLAASLLSFNIEVTPIEVRVVQNTITRR